MIRRFVVVLLTVLTAGCGADLFHSDREALDRFSHAYTDFQNATHETWILLQVVAADVDPFGFWREFEAALDTRGTNPGRFVHASNAKKLYDSAIAPACDKQGESITALDNAVSNLVEAANRIHRQEYRTEATEAAKQAREVQAAYSDISNLWSQRLDIQIEVLQNILADSGQIRGTASFISGGQRVQELSTDINAAGKRVANATRKLKDAFSALKGKAQIRAYQTKEEKDPSLN